VALYNPKGKKRQELFFRMIDIMLQYRPPHTPVGIVSSAYRQEQEVILTRLDNVSAIEEKITMNTVLIIGNTQTYTKGAYMITPRGYV
jgi:precorrin-3B methylase